MTRAFVDKTRTSSAKRLIAAFPGYDTQPGFGRFRCLGLLHCHPEQSEGPM